MIERADADQDGFVSEEEFYNLLTKKYWSGTSMIIWNLVKSINFKKKSHVYFQRLT